MEEWSAVPMEEYGEAANECIVAYCAAQCNWHMWRRNKVPTGRQRRRQCVRSLSMDISGNVEIRMKTRVKWIEGVSFVGESGSGHAVVLDGAPENGGRNIGMRPMEMLLTGAAACTAYDVVTILRKGRHAVDDVVVTIEGTRAPASPRVFAALHYVYRVAGHGLDRRAVERAVELSKEKYCSATIMLGKTATITYEVELVDSTRVPAPG